MIDFFYFFINFIFNHLFIFNHTMILLIQLLRSPTYFLCIYELPTAVAAIALLPTYFNLFFICKLFNTRFNLG